MPAQPPNSLFSSFLLKLFQIIPLHTQTQSYLLQASAEPLKDSLHVSSLLHRDDSCVILLIDPNQECLLNVVPAHRLRT